MGVFFDFLENLNPEAIFSPQSRRLIAQVFSAQAPPDGAQPAPPGLRTIAEKWQEAYKVLQDIWRQPQDDKVFFSLKSY